MDFIQYKKDTLKRISTYISLYQNDELNKILVQKNSFVSRGEIIRKAIDEFLKKH